MVIVEKSQIMHGGVKSCGCLRVEAGKRAAARNNPNKPAKKSFNDYTIIGEYVEIYFQSSDKICKIDTEDLEKINDYHWTIDSEGYARSSIGRMHNIIMNDVMIDHKNHDTLDNRKENLRKCTHTQNMLNRHGSHKAKSKYKGVTKSGKYWSAEIKNKEDRKRIGTFDTEVEAAKAYDTYAREWFGEFAFLNFPDEQMSIEEIEKIKHKRGNKKEDN